MGPSLSAMGMVGHKTESIYRRYATSDAGLLREARKARSRSLRDSTTPGATVATRETA